MDFETLWNNLTPYQKALAMSNIATLRQLADKVWQEGYERGFDDGKQVLSTVKIT
jgi:hypothetical protein